MLRAHSLRSDAFSYPVTPLAAFALSGAFDKWDAIGALNVAGNASAFQSMPAWTPSGRHVEGRGLRFGPGPVPEASWIGHRRTCGQGGVSVTPLTPPSLPRAGDAARSADDRSYGRSRAGYWIETTDHHELTDDLDRAGHRAGDCYRTASSRRAHAPSSAEVCRHRTEGAGQLAWENLLVLPSHVLLPVLLRSVGIQGPGATAGPLAAGQASWSRA
jgi:hypothetical protein